MRGRVGRRASGSAPSPVLGVSHLDVTAAARGRLAALGQLAARSLGVLGLAGLLLACSGESSSDGEVCSAETPSAPAQCGGCRDCVARCICETGSSFDGCLTACGLSSSGGEGGSGAVGGSGAEGGSGAAPGGSGGSGAVGGSGGGTFAQATGLRIQEVSIWQSVKVPLMQNGGAVSSPNAPVIAGRPALVRVYVSPDAEWQQRELVARVEIDGQAFEGRAAPAAASADGDLGSSFNVQIPAAAIQPGSSYAVTLLETSPNPGPGSSAGTRFPSGGAEALNAQDARGSLQVVLVPIEVGGFTPDVGPARVQSYVDRLTALMPVSGVEMSVRQAVRFDGNVRANGNGWSSVLSAIYRLRQQDNPARRVYYYGLLAPAGNAYSFCSSGCVAGLSGMPGASDDYQRGSIGLGHFPDGSDIGAGDTMAHELGHALGRPHTQCQTGENGSGYPYTNGQIGSWGYDVAAARLRAPTTNFDVMGYCNPNWISDYNFKRMFDRLTFVHGGGQLTPPSDPARRPGDFMSFVMDADGSVSRAEDVRLRSHALGEEHEVALVDDAGQVLERLAGFYYPAAEEELGGILLVPRSPGVSHARGLSSGLTPAGVITPLTKTTFGLRELP
ncbi:MAG: hypothetical protein KIT72_13595 [Polyangiaceae bacterium]|nr:hypothetical protein [Polyangiaceae bacterium]MCW5791445.1 hypothetical protein [Polyangiaceae bacterium]